METELLRELGFVTSGIGAASVLLLLLAWRS